MLEVVSSTYGFPSEAQGWEDPSKNCKYGLASITGLFCRGLLSKLDEVMQVLLFVPTQLFADKVGRFRWCLSLPSRSP